MPVYTYRCDNCGIQFDEKERFDDPTMTVCPECEEKSIHRVYRPVGIVFKGSGFYATDNRSPSGKEARKHDKEDGSTKTEKAEEKSAKKQDFKSKKKDTKVDKKKEC